MNDFTGPNWLENLAPLVPHDAGLHPALFIRGQVKQIQEIGEGSTWGGFFADLAAFFKELFHNGSNPKS